MTVRSALHYMPVRRVINATRKGSKCQLENFKMPVGSFLNASPEGSK